MISRVLASLVAFVLASGCATPRPAKRPAGQGGPPTTAVSSDDPSRPVQARSAAYISQVREAASQAWRPEEALDRRDPERTLFGRRDRFTLLTVTLDEAGQIKKIVVARSSGMDFLDQCAVAAFREARPFPSPPAELLDESGELRWTFTFHLKMTRSR